MDFGRFGRSEVMVDLGNGMAYPTTMRTFPTTMMTHPMD
jgi:hypothetical protein